MMPERRCQTLKHVSPTAAWGFWDSLISGSKMRNHASQFDAIGYKVTLESAA